MRRRAVERFQTLQTRLRPSCLLTGAAAAERFGDLQRRRRRVDTTLPGEYVRFVHDTLVDGSRATFAPTLSVPRVSPGWYITPKMGLRYTTYQLERTAAPRAGQARGSHSVFSVDSGLAFERAKRMFGQAYTQTLEPRFSMSAFAYHTRTTFRSSTTTLADFNYSQLFTENRSSAATASATRTRRRSP